MSLDMWIAMGGQICEHCHTCHQSKGSLATYLGREETNTVFKQCGYHFFVFPLSSRILLMADWESWLTQDDVDGMVAAGLNSIHVPLGFWIIEDIVDQIHEPYAQGGLDELVGVLWHILQGNVFL
ncbi:glycoside hydrolase family 5 protein [Piloderma croceum F 1598]|uniref:Glycoside hydrolase family 5 protein n=1 Tax=Piloderma croceum (strain F 1598) TaxID=765440 RepID=A0A0C3EUE8_PILCF|nr:glycoside hydrolase family 5 protein [Piloderma croceum F 1598]